MKTWNHFPSQRVSASLPLFRIHGRKHHPAWFNSDGTWRFDPLPSHRVRYGVCYLGLSEIASYVEVFGRYRAVPMGELTRRAVSELTVTRELQIADLTDRSVLGGFGVTGAHSMGRDYGLSQQLSLDLYEAHFDGILYRIRNDPAMILEAIALFGEAGLHPERFETLKTYNIPSHVIAQGRTFGIEVVPSARLP